MEKIELLRERIELLLELTKPELLPQNECLKIFNAGYVTALKTVLEMSHF